MVSFHSLFLESHFLFSSVVAKVCSLTFILFLVVLCSFCPKGEPPLAYVCCIPKVIFIVMHMLRGSSFWLFVSVFVCYKSLESCHQSPKRGRFKVYTSSLYVLMIDDNSTCDLTVCLSFRSRLLDALGGQFQG